ncbi:MAG: T9SS type A sorting domain-containing protein [Cytophagales bacterium]|nr:T9SS type A sorting domain-containing protein [Cytophagales bacterium]
MTVVASTTVDSLGNYVFDNVLIGQYLVIAKGDSLLYPNTVPTYYDTTNHWQKAIIIDVSSCDTTIIANIKLIEFPSEIGPGKLSGQVNHNGSGKISLIAGVPLQGVDIMIVQAFNGSVVGYTITDSSGNYSFENIPFGDYKLYVDITGLPMDSTYYVKITLTDSVFTNLNFYIDSTSIGIEIATVITEKIFEDNDFKVYPNPYSDKTQITYHLTKKATVTLEIFNIVGKKVKTLINEVKYKGEHQYFFSTKEFGYEPGVYILKLSVDDKIYTRRLMEF